MLARSGGGAILLDDVPVLPREGSGVAVESLGFSGHQPSKLALGAEEERELAAASANEGIHTNSTSSSSRSSGFSSGETQEERTDRYIRAHLTSLQERGVLGSRGSDGDVGKAGEEGMEGGESRDIGASLEVMGAEAEVAVPSSVVPTKGSIQHRNLTLAESIAFSDKYRTRKPRYFNKVKTGYDWNKYNKAHYDKENPPPRTVQGYMFNIFYPDLLDRTRTPKFRLEPCLESEDFVLVVFEGGPPYEPVAFKIVNKEWNYGRKHGFKCLFDRGVLQLYFNFARSRYRS